MFRSPHSVDTGFDVYQCLDRHAQLMFRSPRSVDVLLNRNDDKSQNVDRRKVGCEQDRRGGWKVEFCLRVGVGFELGVRREAAWKLARDVCRKRLRYEGFRSRFFCSMLSSLRRGRVGMYKEGDERPAGGTW